MVTIFPLLQPWLILLSAFAFIALGAKQLGQSLSAYKLPLISGFLIAGVLAGPFVLNLITEQNVINLRFIDDIALAFIAFSAGNELYIKEIRPRITGISFITLAIGTATVYAMTTFGDFVPFMTDMNSTEWLAVAVVNELRAKGPLTKTAIGMTIAGSQNPSNDIA